MFNFFNIFSKKENNVNDDTLLSNSDSLADKNNSEYSVLFSNGTNTIMGIPDKNLIPGIYKTHLIELAIHDDYCNKQLIIKKETNSYTNINEEIFIINNINFIIPYTRGKFIFSIKPYNNFVSDNMIENITQFSFKLNENPPKKSYIAIEEKNKKLLLFLTVSNNIYSIKELEYHIPK